MLVPRFFEVFSRFFRRRARQKGWRGAAGAVAPGGRRTMGDWAVRLCC